MFKYLKYRIKSAGNVRNLLIRQRFALAYAVVGWHACLYAIYLSMKDDLPTNSEERQLFAQRMMKKYNNDVTFLKFDGNSVTKTIYNVENSSSDTV